MSYRPLPHFEELPPEPEPGRNGQAVVRRVGQEIALGVVTLLVAGLVLGPSFYLIHFLFLEGLGLTLAVVGGFGIVFAIYLAYRSGALFARR